MKFRKTIFTIHRYIGLFVGLVLVLVGLTGSLLVFQREIDSTLLINKVGYVVPQTHKVSLASLVENTKTAYQDNPDFIGLQITSIKFPDKHNLPIMISGRGQVKDRSLKIAIDPYSGKILAGYVWESSFYGLVYQIHYALLSGSIGIIVVGIAAGLIFILSLTGVALWPGWRKISAGFKIKVDAHPKRLNFDIHKVVGIVTAIFLAITAFTGFCWNFSQQTEPLIYAATLTARPQEQVSQPIPAKSPLSIDEISQRVNAAFPEGTTTYIDIPTEPQGTYRVGKHLPQDINDWGSSKVYLDQYSGKVLQIRDGRSLSLGDQVLDLFYPLHYGTFGGLPTRILYLFVGLAPTILMTTGFVMWFYRRRTKSIVARPMKG